MSRATRGSCRGRRRGRCFAEQQVGRQNEFVAGMRRRPLMLIHPVRRKHQQAPGHWLYREPELRKARLAAIDDVIQVPKQYEVAVGDRIDRIEMQLKALVGLGSVLLERQIGMLRRVWQRDGQSNVSIISLKRRIDAPAEVMSERLVREARHVELRPSRVLQSAPYAPSIDDLKPRQTLKRVEHASTKVLFKMIIVYAHIVRQVADSHAAYDRTR